MGASTALNVVASEMMAKELGAGNTIVTILCGIIPSSIEMANRYRWCISISDASIQQEMARE